MAPISDGSASFLLGQNASRDPDQIPREAYASGINVNIQRGVLSPRWGFHEKELIFNTGSITFPNLQSRTFEEIFRSGRFQAMIPYKVGTEFFLIIVVSGIIFVIDQATFEVSVLSIAGGSTLDETTPRLNWTPAGRFLVIFDYPAYPVIIEGFQARRANPAAFEIPISTLGAYNQNRLFIANAGNEYTGGDPSGSLAAPDAPITFQEVQVPGSPYFGQIFQLPTSYDNREITATGFLQSVDTGTGIGPLILGTEKEIYSVQTQLPRAEWENSTFASMTVYQAGIAGPRSMVNVLSDLFFYSSDGELRALSQSRAEQGKWSKVPLSREVQNWLTLRDTKLAPYTALSYFNNKIIVAANPTRVRALSQQGQPISDVCFGGFVVLEMDSISTSTEASPPAWAGLWTGVRPMDYVLNNDRFFIMSKDPASENVLYQMDPATTYDTHKGKVRRVRSRVYTREYNFESPYTNKEVNNIDFNLSEVKGTFNMDVAYKPSHSERYLPWRSFSHEAPWRTCKVPVGCEYNGFAGHSFRELILGSPTGAEECNLVTQDNYSFFRMIQLRLDIVGIYWEIKGFAIYATPKQLNLTQPICEPYETVTVCKPCSDDWKYPEEDPCQTISPL